MCVTGVSAVLVLMEKLFNYVYMCVYCILCVCVYMCVLCAYKPLLSCMCYWPRGALPAAVAKVGRIERDMRSRGVEAVIRNRWIGKGEIKM